MTVGNRKRRQAGCLPFSRGLTRAGARASATCLGLGAAILAGCGGGGTSATSTGSPAPLSTPPVTIEYADSIVVGVLGQQPITYTSATSVAPAFVSATTGSPLLAAGDTVVVAEHVDSALPGLREICVSGDGQSVNVIGNINLGVGSKGAAVLLDPSWTPANSSDAWAAAVTAGTKLSGWENCGVKPEGLPSQSSLLSPLGDGSYREDVYDGNPSTTFNTITQTIPAPQVDAMLSAGGFASTADLARPLQLYLRAFKSTTGAVVFLEIGIANGPGEDPRQGFVELYAATN